MWGCDQAETPPCAALIAEHIPGGRTWLSTDEWPRDRGSHPDQATVRHGVREWARDDDDEGRREVHGHTGEGGGRGTAD